MTLWLGSVYPGDSTLVSLCTFLYLQDLPSRSLAFLFAKLGFLKTVQF